MTTEFDTFNQMSLQTYSVDETKREDVGYIMLFGMTGAGKSTFISRLTGQNPQEVGVGHGLASSTVDTACYTAQFEPNITINFIDTPGFDDTARPNADILRPIADCLAALQREGKPLLGIICLQRITDVRLSGSAIRTFEVLRRICGVNSYDRVILATTMWGELDDARKQDALVRESRLHEYWGGMFNEQSEMILHRDGETGEEMARRAVGALLERSTGGGYYPPLLIQYEMVVKDKPVGVTDAGKYIRGELMSAQQKRLAELEEAIDKVKRESDGLRQRQQQQQQQQQQSTDDTWSQSVLALARPSFSALQSSKPTRSCLPSASSIGVYSAHDRVDSYNSDMVRGDVSETRSVVSRIVSGAAGLFGLVVHWLSNDTDRTENGDRRDARPPTRARSRSFLGKF